MRRLATAAGLAAVAVLLAGAGTPNGYLMSWNGDAGRTSWTAPPAGPGGSATHPLCAAGEKLFNDDAGYRCLPESSAPTNAEFVTYAANATLTAERVLSNGTNTTVDTATTGQVKINVTSPLPVGNGGTGNASMTLTNGALVYANGSNLAAYKGTDNYLVQWYSGVPQSVALPLAGTNGGTGLSTTTQGGVLYGGATNTTAWTAAGTSGQVLTSAGTGAPTWTNTSQSTLLTSDYTTTTSKVNTGLSWSLPAGKKQQFYCWLEVQDQAAAVGISLQLASSQTLVRVFFRSLIYKTSTTALTTEVGTALTTTIPAAVCAASCVTSSKGWEISGSLEGHATNAATITVQASSATAGAKVKAGSFCSAYNN